MRALPLLCMTILLPAAAATLQAQGPGTAVGGPILSDTTWTLAGSPYDMTASILIGLDATLTIDPGVVVRIEPLRSILIGSTALGGGSLVARGTEAQPILFTRSSTGAVNWNSIEFSDLSADATYAVDGTYTGGSILEHCVVEFGGGGGAPTAVKVLSASPFLHAVTVRDSATLGVTVTGGATIPGIRVADCDIRNNGTSIGHHGFELVSGNGHEITGTSVMGNAGTGMICQSATISLADCQLANNNDRGAIFTSCTVSISGCLFDGNAGDGVRLSSCQNSNVSDCVVRGNTRGIALQQSSNSMIDRNLVVSNGPASGGAGIDIILSSGIQVANNIVANNTASGNAGGIRASSSSVILSNNTIDHNSAGGSGGGICSESAPSVVSVIGGVITNNTAGVDGGGLIIGATATFVGVTIACNRAMNRGGGMFFSGNVTLDGDQTANSFNTIQGNSAPQGDAIFNARAFNPSGSGNLSTDFVCWGPTNPAVQPNRIWDFFDDSSLGIVVTTNLVACEAFADLGLGLAGVAGIPALSITGDFSGAGAIQLALANGAPNAPSAMLINTVADFVYVPSLEAIIIPGLGAGGFSINFSTDANGAYGLTIPIGASSALAGLKFSFQAIVIDAASSNGFFSLSNGYVGLP